MGKGIAALAYLPQVDLILDAANSAASLKSFRGLANTIAKLQADETPDGTYTGVRAGSNDPYSISVWDIVIADSGATYTATLVSETVSESLGNGRAALSVRRGVDLVKATGEPVTMRSFLAALNFVEGLEDKVAVTGTSTEGDGTYTDVALRGHTPFKTYKWTIVKAADAYTLTSTTESN